MWNRDGSVFLPRGFQSFLATLGKAEFSLTTLLDLKGEGSRLPSMFAGLESLEAHGRRRCVTPGVSQAPSVRFAMKCFPKGTLQSIMGAPAVTGVGLLAKNTDST